MMSAMKSTISATSRTKTWRTGMLAYRQIEGIDDGWPQRADQIHAVGEADRPQANDAQAEECRLGRGKL